MPIKSNPKCFLLTGVEMVSMWCILVWNYEVLYTYIYERKKYYVYTTYSQ